MKKIVCSIAIIAAFAFNATNANAQGGQPATKFAVFDVEIMLQAMPGYREIDSLVQRYEVDSLGTEYDFYLSEFKRQDSTYKADSAAGKPKNVLDLIARERGQTYFTLAYWKQIAQNKSDGKRAVLAQPLYEKIGAAYNKILASKKYDLILKPSAVEVGSKVDNLFILVAKELKITLPEELGGSGEPEPAADKPAQKPAKPAAKPKG